MEARADRFDGQMQQNDGDGRAEGDDDRSRDALGKLETENHDGDGNDGESRRRHGDGVPCCAERFHAMEEVAGDMVHAQAKKIANLRAGNERWRCRS